MAVKVDQSKKEHHSVCEYFFKVSDEVIWSEIFDLSVNYKVNDRVLHTYLAGRNYSPFTL